jgi:hypothetical protein
VRIRCERATVNADDTPPGLDTLTGRILYYTRDRRVEVALETRASDGARLRFDGSVDGTSWSAQLRIEDLGLTMAERLSAAVLTPGLPPPVADAPATPGAVQLALAARGRGGDVDEARIDLTVSDLAAANAAGTLAAEGLELSVTGTFSTQQGATEFELDIAAPTGEVYREPVYADLARHPLRITAAGTANRESVTLREFEIDLQQVLTGTGQGTARATEPQRWQVTDALLTFERMTLPGAYDVLLQPLLARTVLGDVETSGSLGGHLRYQHNTLVEAVIDLQDVSLDDRNDRLATYGLRGDLVFTQRQGWRPRSLRWQGGFVYGIAFGAAAATFELLADGWRLTPPLSLPVLDGTLEINVLESAAAAGERADMAFDAQLTPVDMGSLARALDWPPLAGQLSGRLPDLSYENGEITVAGALQAEVFDGEVTVTGLRIREPFSERALLQADIELTGLDLETMTRTFSFGLVTGRLDGYVRDLAMVGWTPVAFDARVFTTPGDRSRHRISQRAVDNIASLGGGGGTPGLSTGLLGIFDEFAYDRLGLGCRLERQVCTMSGIEDVGNGFLILRGRGLPQIEVVGFAERVDWPTLLAQIRSIIRSEGPVIESQ